MRELVKPGLLLDCSLKSFNSWGSDRGCSCLHLQLPWADPGWSRAGASAGCWSLPGAPRCHFTAGFACRSCRSLSGFGHFSVLTMTYCATSEPLAPFHAKRSAVKSAEFFLCVCLTRNLTCFCFVNRTKLKKKAFKNVLAAEILVLKGVNQLLKISWIWWSSSFWKSVKLLCECWHCAF